MKQNKIWSYYQTENQETFNGNIHRSYFLAKKCKNKKVLNIGIGNGMFEYLSLQFTPYVYSLDPDKSTVIRLRKSLKLNSDNIKVGYSQEIPFQSNFFDVVVMSEVLEHLENEEIEMTLKEVKRVLKRDGKFIGTVPYNENLKNNLVVCPKCGFVFHRWGHVQNFDEKKLKEVLSTQFQDVRIKIKKFSSMNILTTKGKILSFLGLSKYFFLKILNVSDLGENIYFECFKKC